MKKRLIWLAVLIVALLLACMPTCFAGEVEVDGEYLYDIEFYVEDVTADFGGTTVDVGIDVKRNTGMAGLIYELSYDDTFFTIAGEPAFGSVTGIEVDGFGSTEQSPHLGMLSTPDGSLMMGNGRLLTYTFNISPDAAAGTYPVEIKLSGKSSVNQNVDLEVLDDMMISVDSVIYNGSITIPGYKIKFDANGGEGEPDNLTKTYGKDLTLPTAEPERDGYDFLGWATDKNVTEAQFEAGGTFDIDADITLYAVWTLNTDTLLLTLTPGEISKVEIEEGVFEKQVAVTVSLTQNPGFSSVEFYLDYDKTRLKYNCSEQLAVGPMFVPPVTDEYPFSFAYVGATELNYTKENDLFKIVFSVLDDAEVGDAYVNLVANNELCLYNNGTNDVPLSTVVNNTAITVSEAQLLGDINLDGVVDINDAILLFQHSMLPAVYSISYNGDVDFNKDGYIDINDAILLFQYSMMPNIYPIS